MAMRRNPGSTGPFYFVRNDVDNYLHTCGYRLARADKNGLRYEFSGDEVFFFSYYNASARRKKLPEVHILPTGVKDQALLALLRRRYQHYLRQIGKGFLVSNVVVQGKGVQIKQALDRNSHLVPPPIQMDWDDIRDIVLNLDRVHKNAPPCSVPSGQRVSIRRRAAVRKASAKKKAVKQPPAKTTMTKKPARQKTTAITATDQVLKIVRRFSKGVDVRTLVQKTGLSPTTLRNVVSRATKQGKIKRVDEGVYARV